MRRYTHGGDVYSPGLKDMRIYDFSANINPLGMPEAVRKAAEDSISLCGAYPDPVCRELTGAVAECEGVDPGRIVFGCGAADLIYRTAAALRPEKALLCSPTFSEYEKALREAGSTVVHHDLDASWGYSLDEGILRSIERCEGLDAVFLCNPNNPVGNLTGRDLMRRILELCAERGAVLAVDECFAFFTGREEECTMKRFLDSFDNLVIFKAFTKTFAMAGLRLGYMMAGSRRLADRVFSTGQPWSVSVPAQHAGAAALEEKEYLERSLELIGRERPVLTEALRRKGFRVFEPEANYILFSGEKCGLFRRRMREKGILIRDCGDYRGLDGSFSRIAVRSPEENRFFIGAMEETDLWEKL